MAELVHDFVQRLAQCAFIDGASKAGLCPVPTGLARGSAVLSLLAEHFASPPPPSREYNQQRQERTAP